MFEDINKSGAGRETRLPNNVERNKNGLLHPHNVPQRCCEHISAEFVTEFPITERGSNSVLVVLKKSLKLVVLVPMKKKADLGKVSYLFKIYVISKFCVPENLTSDQDPKCTVSYWKTH